MPAAFVITGATSMTSLAALLEDAQQRSSMIHGNGRKNSALHPLPFFHTDHWSRSVNVALGDQIGCASAASSSSVRSTSASAASTASTRSETSTTTITIVTVSSPASSSTHSPTAEETRTTAALSSPATVTVTFVAEPPTEAAAPSGSGMKIGVGAGVGIGMGAAVGALLLLASIIVWCRRRRARGTNGNGSTTAAASSPLDFGYTEVGQGAHASELGHRDHYAAVEASEQDGFELSSLPSDYQEMPTAFNTPRPRSELVAEQSAPPVSPAPPRPARSSPVPGEEGENFFEA
ncbi:MAG: hypothetical protein M1836_002627 [Candelina mexicana]|nr:MAG: hypothetical protein M1836_002627 [Candelina mexicana]